MTSVLASYDVVRHREMSFSAEPMSKVLNDEAFNGLLKQNAEELAGALGYEIEIDRDHYVYLASQSVSHMFTIRAEGELVGYAAYFVSENPQCKGTKRAVQDALFIHPANRKGGTAMRFIDYCCDQLGKRGVDIVYQVTNTHIDFGRTLRLMGFREVEHVYARRTR
jgi:N-acetylglutamate synthase-like GNAT family acetyltransferase